MTSGQADKMSYAILDMPPLYTLGNLEQQVGNAHPPIRNEYKYWGILVTILFTHIMFIGLLIILTRFL